jgi:hypothetical protein
MSNVEIATDAWTWHGMWVVVRSSHVTHCPSQHEPFLLRVHQVSHRHTEVRVEPRCERRLLALKVGRRARSEVSSHARAASDQRDKVTKTRVAIEHGGINGKVYIQTIEDHEIGKRWTRASSYVLEVACRQHRLEKPQSCWQHIRCVYLHLQKLKQCPSDRVRLGERCDVMHPCWQ